MRSSGCSFSSYSHTMLPDLPRTSRTGAHFGTSQSFPTQHRAPLSEGGTRVLPECPKEGRLPLHHFLSRSATPPPLLAPSYPHPLYPVSTDRICFKIMMMMTISLAQLGSRLPAAAGRLSTTSKEHAQRFQACSFCGEEARVGPEGILAAAPS